LALPIPKQTPNPPLAWLVSASNTARVIADGVENRPTDAESRKKRSLGLQLSPPRGRRSSLAKLREGRGGAGEDRRRSRGRRGDRNGGRPVLFPLYVQYYATQLPPLLYLFFFPIRETKNTAGSFGSSHPPRPLLVLRLLVFTSSRAYEAATRTLGWGGTLTLSLLTWCCGWPGPSPLAFPRLPSLLFIPRSFSRDWSGPPSASIRACDG
jgi:hypothetical protein